MKMYSEQDLKYVLDSLNLLSEEEKRALYGAYAHGTAHFTLESRKIYVLNSIQEAVLTHTPEDGETPMHTAFKYLYDRSRHWLGFSASEVVYRTYYLICSRRPEKRQELAIASRMIGEMQLYNSDSTPDTMREAEEMLARSLIIYNQISLRDSNIKAGRANTLSSTAVLLMTQGKTSEAERLLIEAKRVFRDLSYRGCEEWRPYYAGSLINLADLYSKTGKVTDAIHCYRRAANVLKRCKVHDPYFIQYAIDHVTAELDALDYKK